MRAWLKIARLGRPALAVAALYAFVLGTYLGTFAPPAVAGLAAHVLCSTQGAAGSPGPATPAAAHRDCCTAACAAGFSLAPPATGASIPIPWALTIVDWTFGTDPALAPATVRDIRVRGPPSV